MEHKIILRDPQQLKTLYAEYNPRRISAEEMGRLKDSIKAFGFVVPILINKTTGRIIAGHQRVQAAIELGLKEVPTVTLEVTEDNEKFLNIALNRIKGKFDMEKLDQMFTELA